MDEFSLIERFFKSIASDRPDVILGVGDDAAILNVPKDHQLLVSCDTLVADVHFCTDWDAYDIAYKAVMVNISDIAAMAGRPSWITLGLTLPTLDEAWLQRFSDGLRAALLPYPVALIGGDTTRGPMSMTLTVHGFVPVGRAVRRSGARPGDIIYVTGELGAAALAVDFLTREGCDAQDWPLLLDKLQHPTPRVDWVDYLQTHATACIDISDGLSADLHHICTASLVGARLTVDQIPVHPLVKKYKQGHALDFALSGGDDYELCFTIPPAREATLLRELASAGLQGYAIGTIEATTGLRLKRPDTECVPLSPRGYAHF
ncbi:MAG TPA: thiamine-phosphate kinase [Legionella sp.]|nr:thiamine-phosphate kinase [Legionella sp.]